MMSDALLYSMFLIEAKSPISGDYMSRHTFYEGHGHHLDIKTHFALREVPGKRKEAVFLGLVMTDFPVKYPLKTTTGELINELENPYA